MQDIDLVHPFYLHVPMMTSFVAALNNGVAHEVGRRLASRTTTHGKAEGEARAGLLPPISALLNFDLRGKLSADKESGSDEEQAMILRYTEASLFIRLRATLAKENKPRRFDLSADTLQDISPGELIEVEGTFHRNPLDATIVLLRKVLPLADLASATSLPGHGSHTSKKGSYVRPTQGTRQTDPQIEMFKALTDELDTTRVHDVLVQPVTKGGIKCILPLSDEHFAESSYEELFGGQFRVLGKVTSKVAETERINLLKRSVLGYFPQADDLFTQLESGAGLANLQIGQSTVEGPALHLFPLAVFV